MTRTITDTSVFREPARGRDGVPFQGRIQASELCKLGSPNLSISSETSDRVIFMIVIGNLYIAGCGLNKPREQGNYMCGTEPWIAR